MSGRDRYRDRYRHDFPACHSGAPTPCRPPGGQARRANTPASGERGYRAGVTPRARTPAREPEPGGTRRPAGPSSTESGPLSTDQLVERARTEWRAALVAEAGDSALADVDRLKDALLDLSAAHPSGIAQLFAGRTTRLSNLVREGSALSAAKRRARAVASRAEDYAQRYGLASAFLAIGVAHVVCDVVGPTRRRLRLRGLLGPG